MLTDVTATWDELLATLPGASPYQSSAWGRTVASVFGGRFHVLRLDADLPRYVPVLIGGWVGGDGFCCGHLGYGGVLDERDGIGVSIAEQCRAVREVSRWLERPCRRLVTAARPDDGWAGTGHDLVAGAEVRRTRLVPLTADPELLWSTCTAGARQQVRRAQREGVRTQPLPAELIPTAGALIRDTQVAVGSPHRPPDRLLTAIAALGPERGLLLGCWLGEELIATGVFLRFHGRVAYVLSGWRREYARLAPTYPLVFEALRRCGAAGDVVMDLGHSPRESLAAFKRRWGGQDGAFVALDSEAIGR